MADTRNNRIRKISSAGVVSTLAGSGSDAFADGAGTLASFSRPSAVALDGAGNVYVADGGSFLIRKINSSGTVSTLAGGMKQYLGGAQYEFADGAGTSALFYNPDGLTLDSVGNVYVADAGFNRIRKITPSGMVSTFAGSGSAAFADGAATSASFNNPSGLALDTSGTVYVADYSNNRIRKISPAGVVSTFAGSGSAAFADGTGTSASFNGPSGLALDTRGNVYVADQGNNRIRMVSPSGVVSTLAGGGKTVGTYGDSVPCIDGVSFYEPSGVALDDAGNVYVADQSNHRISNISVSYQYH